MLVMLEEASEDCRMEDLQNHVCAIPHVEGRAMCGWAYTGAWFGLHFWEYFGEHWHG
jgi:hypothetical protein